MSSLPATNGPVQREQQLALVGAPADPETIPILAGELLPAAPEPPQTACTEDGYVYDINTGEVLGHYEVEERFEVRDVDAANWVLEQRSQIEGRLAGLVARKQAVLEQLNALIGVERRKLSWWEMRFGPSLTAFARQVLGDGKSRTWRCVWGSVAFRKTKGTTSIIDNEQALGFVELWAPQLVKIVRSVNVTAVKGALDVARAQCPDDEIDTPFVVTSGETESVTISTGIEVKP